MLKDKITEFFVSIDDFCIDFELEIQKHLLESSTNKSRRRATSLADFEILTILVMFHYGQFSNLKSYYNHYVYVHKKDLFPGLVSCNRFIELQGRVAIPLMLFLKLKGLGSATGISFVD